jgi:hypothetical protein
MTHDYAHPRRSRRPRFPHGLPLHSCNESRTVSSPYIGRQKQAIQYLEAIMKKEIFQENKARWEVFEWIGSTRTKIIWAIAAVVVVLGIIYLVR